MSKNRPLKKIREKCLDCSGGHRKEVRLCPVEDCPLYPFRMGIKPETAQKRGIEIGGSKSEN